MKLRHTLIAALFLLAAPFIRQAKAFNLLPIAPDTMGLRSDTINVLHYTINLNISTTVDTLKGNTIVQFTPKMNGIKTLCLDLENMVVDSIIMNNTHLTFSYTNNVLITMNLPAIMNIGDTGNADVYYHGRPVQDPVSFGGVRWGGFYDTLGYAFNLGVGFAAKPHNFGRAWYPCFDNFIAKSTFTFNIICDSANRSFCNGYLIKDSVAGALRYRTWNMPQKISSYHASVDVAPYTTVLDTFRGVDTIPIVIACEPAYVNNVHASFIHLKNAISIFQNCYGHYGWNKVGYSLVAFNDGAMEHASNIAYPKICADGSLNYEADIMAHELSHHWCGDLVTCSSAEQMWLNEGFAVFNQSIFEEYMYGENTYHTYTRSNHDNVIHYCAIADHGYWALANMPQPYTYGNLNYWVSTTYQKGADVMYTLRNYLGDSAFFKGMRYYFSSHAYQPVNSDTLKNSLQRSSGYNLTDFFNDWVYAPGFPQFSIDSTKITGNGPYTVTVYVKQKLMGAPAYYNNVPIDFTFKAANWTTNTQNVLVSGHISNYTFTVPFKPVFTGLDVKGKLAQAISSDTVIAKAVTTYNKVNSRVDLTVTSITDSAFLFFEHNFAAADTLGTGAQHYRISPYRYWKITGVKPANFVATAKLYYDGRKSPGVTNGSEYLDTNLCIVTSDSLILLYRPNAGTGWTEFPGYTKHPVGPLTAKYGYMLLDSVPFGEYAFANGKSHVLQGIQTIGSAASTMKLYPNPTSNNFTVEFASSQSKQLVSVYDMQGKLVKQLAVSPGQKVCTINTADWANGTYVVTLSNNSKNIDRKQIVVSH